MSPYVTYVDGLYVTICNVCRQYVYVTIPAEDYWCYFIGKPLWSQCNHLMYSMLPGSGCGLIQIVSRFVMLFEVILFYCNFSLGYSYQVGVLHWKWFPIFVTYVRDCLFGTNESRSSRLLRVRNCNYYNPQTHRDVCVMSRVSVWLYKFVAYL
jgi:hypothetical protein